MKRAIIIHGMPSKDEYMSDEYPSPSNSHWVPWIQKQLTMRGYDVQTPEMPDGYEPNYEKWKMAFERLNPDEDTVLVGHSCGGGFIVRWLSENNIQVGKVVLVAPWIDPEHEEQEYISDFFDFEIDQNIASNTEGITVYVSTDDDNSILRTVEILEQKLKDIEVKRFDGKGHFTERDMGTIEFPELLEEVIE